MGGAAEETGGLGWAGLGVCAGAADSPRGAQSPRRRGGLGGSRQAIAGRRGGLGQGGAAVCESRPGARGPECVSHERDGRRHCGSRL
jgi:hypothetical protein